MRFACIGALVLVSSAARADCPCYSSNASPNPNKCGVADVGGTNPDNATWGTIIDSASLGPTDSSWTGPAIATIHDGCGANATDVDAHFPCELIDAILQQESGWRQFCAPTAPADRVGAGSRTIVSEDCGYGVAQVTTDMHTGETAPWTRAEVASDPRYDVEVGLYLLATKWRAVACVGKNDPSVVEDWYLATWAYNSYAYANDPNNPNFDAVRTVCDPNVGCSARPYQEYVWAWMEHPPTDGRFAAIEPAYPQLDDIPKTSATPGTQPEPSCASPTSCATPRSVHVSRCAPGQEMPADLAGEEPDLRAIDAGPSPSGKRDTGCGCDVGGHRPHFLALWLVMLALVWRRRWR